MVGKTKVSLRASNGSENTLRSGSSVAWRTAGDTCNVVRSLNLGRNHTALRRSTSGLAIAAVVLALAACGGGPRLYPVHGKVTWDNGAEARELAGGLMICESVVGGVGARGDIETDSSSLEGRPFFPGSQTRSR